MNRVFGSACRANVAWLFLIFLTTIHSSTAIAGTPHISALSPSSVVAGSGDLTLTVTGSNFIPGAPGTGSFVNFDSNGAATTYVSSTTLTAVIPASNFVSAGSHSVQVFNSWTLSSNVATFTVTSNNPVPAITSLSPSTATAGGPAFQLVVNGNNFVSSSVVHWGSAVLSTTYVSATQITAAVPAADIATASTVMVSVVSPSPGGGTSNSYTFTVGSSTPAPAITSLSPSTAVAGGAAFTLVVNGSNFVSSSVVNWSGAALTTTYVSASQITAAVPAADIASPGTANITVTNPAPGGGTSGSVAFTISGTAGNLVMYQNGTRNLTLWPATYDYSYGASPPVDYSYATNPESGHTQSLAIYGNSGWQQATIWDTAPYGVDLRGYVELQFDVYVPASGNSLIAQAHYSRISGDDIPTSTGLTTTIEASCGTITPGQWNIGKRIRLSHLGMLASQAYYKFLIQTQPGFTAQLDNVQFVAGVQSMLYNNNALTSGWSAAATNGSVNLSFVPNSVGSNLFALNQPQGTTQTVAEVTAIAVTGTSVHSALTFSYAGGFSLSGLNRFTFGALPTKSGYGYTVQFYDTSGVAVGNAVNVAAYAPIDFGVNTSNWTVYDFPLSDAGTLPASIGSVKITETSSNSTNEWYITAPGFTS